MLKRCGRPDMKQRQKESLVDVVLETPNGPLDSEWTRTMAQMVAGWKTESDPSPKMRKVKLISPYELGLELKVTPSSK